MSAEIINLRRARKRRERQAADDAAKSSRLFHGQRKDQRLVTALTERLEADRLEGHRLVGPDRTARAAASSTPAPESPGPAEPASGARNNERPDEGSCGT